ncbi:putative sterigmatocystin biosynthesis P450 monooxygenase stcS [Colletotrichum sp. SAR11_240]|nr:putative sterigmatocystin biosynthesis P450 monooxygenase stcS [Colletotrichum sp. SAR11_240]
MKNNFFSRLPNELVCCIVKCASQNAFQSKRDLLNLCLLNWQMYPFAQLELYRKVEIHSMKAYDLLTRTFIENPNLRNCVREAHISVAGGRFDRWALNVSSWANENLNMTNLCDTDRSLVILCKTLCGIGSPKENSRSVLALLLIFLDRAEEVSLEVNSYCRPLPAHAETVFGQPISVLTPLLSAANLTDLHLIGDTPIWDALGDPDIANVQLPLKTLTLDSSSADGSGLCHLLRRCPNLRRLKASIKSPRRNGRSNINTVLPASCPQLKELSLNTQGYNRFFGNTWVLNPGSTKHITCLPQMHNLKELRITLDCFFDTPANIELLGSSFPDLLAPRLEKIFIDATWSLLGVHGRITASHPQVMAYKKGIEKMITALCTASKSQLPCLKVIALGAKYGKPRQWTKDARKLLAGTNVKLKLERSFYKDKVYMTAIAQRYDMPGAWYLDFWPLAAPVLVVTDADAAQRLLTGTPTLKHPQVGKFMGPVLGEDNIVSVNGEMWKAGKRMMGSGFSQGYVKPMLSMFSEHVLVFHEKLRKRAVDKGEEEFELEGEAAKAIFDVIGSIVFGMSLDAQGKGSVLLEDLRALIQYLNFVITNWNPVRKVVEWWRIRGVKRRSDEVIRKAVLERWEVMRDEGEVPSRRLAKSIMDRVIADWIQSGEQGPPKGEFLDLLVVNLKTLLLGGHGTTTDAFTYTVMLLGLHPEAMRRMREEHDAVFPAGLQESAEMLRTNPAKTNELEYTTAVIKETMRFYPVGFSTRIAPPELKFLDCDGVRLPIEGFMLALCQFASHFDPAYFADPKAFRPERFLGAEGAALHRFAWRPFERGPRACMGQDLAMDELRVLLLLTARWFDFETVPVGKREARTTFFELDALVGDMAFQEMKMGAAVRSGMKMKWTCTWDDVISRSLPEKSAEWRLPWK